MLRLTLSQLRHSLRRLLAAGLAIAIGAAFVTATLLAGDVLERASVQALSAELGDADLVVDGAGLDPDVAGAVDELSGVAASHGVVSVFAQIEAAGTSTFVTVTPAAADPTLTGIVTIAGSDPAPGQIALPERLAGRLNVEVGDEVPVRRSVRRDVGGETTFEEVVERLEVAGMVDGNSTPFGIDAAIGHPDQVLGWAADGDVDGQVWFERLLLRLEPGTSADALAGPITDLGGDLRTSTREAHAEARAAELTGSDNVLVVLGLAFGAVALLVAGLVIANTFSVVVAQRTRTLALLRCVGADRRQLRRSVRLEALLLATVASLLGTAVGLGLAQATLSILAATGGSGLPTTIAPDLAAILVPLVAGVAVTTVAASVPARAASRVAPLAAMRPTGGGEDGPHVGRRRRMVAGLLFVSGSGCLAIGVFLGDAGQVAPGLLLGVLGGGMSFVGVLLGAAVWVPRLLGAAAAGLTRRGGATGALAAANSLRNPRRTAATTSALLIGVTLVAMMASGAAIARASFDQEFARAFPVDAQVVAPDADGQRAALPSDRLAELRALDGVVDAVQTGEVTLLLEPDGPAAVVDVTVVDPAEASTVVRGAGSADALAEGVLLVPEHLAGSLELAKPTVAATPVDAADQPLEGGGNLTVRTGEVSGAEVLMSRATAERLGLDVPFTGAWIRLDDRAEVAAAIGDIQDAVAADGVLVRSDAAERDRFDRIVSTMLAVVGLLGVAVVIALVGVANTLSLSVIERGRESATLRAIGLTRRQLRATLAIEAVLIAGAGAVVGSLLGTVYGWAGARTVLGELSGGVPLSVPWLQLGALIVVSLVAGVGASVLPGRRAARTSPVAALAAG